MTIDNQRNENDHDKDEYEVEYGSQQFRVGDLINGESKGRCGNDSEGK